MVDNLGFNCPTAATDLYFREKQNRVLELGICFPLFLIGH